MKPKEKVIARDKFGTPITIVSYVDEGKLYHDLSTDGQRVLLTPASSGAVSESIGSVGEEDEGSLKGERNIRL